MAKRTGILDGDIWAYQAALKAEIPVNWGDDFWTLHADEREARQRLDAKLDELTATLELDEMVVAISDPQNFRYDVLPSYKSNRADKRKPMILGELKDYLMEKYESYQKEGLEGDDVLGILGTHPKLLEGEKIMITIDKDLKTVPGLHFNANKKDQGIYEVTEEEADIFHMAQTLAGDTTDGYSGCPGVGMDTAMKVLANPMTLEAYEHEITRGKRKGEVETRWREGEPCSIWECVVSHYKKAGLKESDALQQARVARICRYTDYDYKKRKVKLWSPRED